MNEITLKTWYSDIEVTFKFDKDADIDKTFEVIYRLLKEMGYWEETIDSMLSERAINALVELNVVS